MSANTSVISGNDSVQISSGMAIIIFPMIQLFFVSSVKFERSTDTVYLI